MITRLKRSARMPISAAALPVVALAALPGVANALKEADKAATGVPQNTNQDTRPKSVWSFRCGGWLRSTKEIPSEERDGE